MKWLLRYVVGSSNLKLVYIGNKTSSYEVKGYCDSDFVGDLDKRRSLSRYVFTLGGNTVSWKSSP